MRGKQLLNPTVRIESSKEKRIAERNRFITDRYYYYTNLVQPVTTYEHRIMQIAKEVYLSTATVVGILTSNSNLYNELVQSKQTKKTLQSRHPQYIWP